MEEDSFGPSPKEILVLGAMLERTLTCDCQANGTPCFDTEEIEFRKSEGHFGKLKSWYSFQELSWDDETLETTSLTNGVENSQGFVLVNMARKNSIIREMEETDDDKLDIFLDKFVPNKQSEKIVSNFVFSKLKQRIHKKPPNALRMSEEQVTPVEGRSDESGFEVEYLL